jgi:hypothetical protein
MSTADEIALNATMDTQSVVFLEKNINGHQPDFNDFDAVLTCVSKMDIVKKLRYRDFTYIIDEFEPLEVSRDIYFQLVLEEEPQNGKQVVPKQMLRLWSDNLPISDIKAYIQRCRQEFESQRNNKLGDDIFFFDQVAANDNKYSTALSFDKKKFTTFRTFDNVFFEEREDVADRVKQSLVCQARHTIHAWIHVSWVARNW